MPILPVRNVPDELYTRIQRWATARNRSFSAQVIQLLDQALQTEEARQTQAKVMAGIRRRRMSYVRKPTTPDSVTLLREDRDR